MKYVTILILGFLLISLPATGIGQSLGDLARKERARKAKQSQTGTVVTNDSVKRLGQALKPTFDASRKDDLDYLMSQLGDPSPAPQVYLSLVPLKAQAEERLLALLRDPMGVKRISPAAALIILGDTRGLGAMAELLPTTVELGRKLQFSATGQSSEGEDFQNALRRTFESTQAVNLAFFGRRGTDTGSPGKKAGGFCDGSDQVTCPRPASLYRRPAAFRFQCSSGCNHLDRDHGAGKRFRL